VETGALARTRGQPLVAALLQRDGNAVRTRMAARLVELAQLVEGLGPLRREAPVRPWVESLPLSPGEGLGAVETARGLLLHRARVADGIVAAYQIVAPTEWNFHARGAAVRGLDGVEVPDEGALVQCARLVVQALDPCVACNVEVGHA
jgi:coenzyme F420-reducing hydrogenase alpha subunit